MPGIPSVINVTDLDGSNGFRILGSDVDEALGSSVAIGDVNGDGIADVIVGAPGNPLDGYADDGAYVIFGHGADATPLPSSVNTVNNLDPTNVFHEPAGAFYPYTNSQAGYSVSYAGDFNGDGIGDFMVSAPYDNGQQGTTYVIFGSPGIANGTPAGSIRIE